MIQPAASEHTNSARQRDRIGGDAVATFDNVALTPQDTANVVPSCEFYQDLHAESEQRTPELCLASEERLAGVFYSDFSSPSDTA